MELRKKKTDLRWIKRSLTSGGVFIILCCVFLAVEHLNRSTHKNLAQARYDLVSGLVSQQLQLIIQSHINVIQVLQERIQENRVEVSPELVTQIASTVKHVYSGFTAINFADPDGVISVVVPEQENQKALGRNLLQRADVSHYLIEARDKHKTMLTHAVPLFQGGVGIVFYAPLYGKNGAFLGWINGVFRVETLIQAFVAAQGFDRGYLQIRFVNQTEPFYRAGVRNSAESFDSVRQFSIENQLVEIALNLDAEAEQHQVLTQMSALLLSLIGIVVSLIIALLLYYLMLSRDDMSTRLAKERFDNVMMNILTHDLANNAFAIRATGHVAMRKLPDEHKVLLEKILQMTDAQTELLGRVRDLRAIEMGKKKLVTTLTPLTELRENAEKLFEMPLRAKGLQLIAESSPHAHSVPVDRVIFQNNVINNLVSNAIKFSDPGSRIILRSRKSGQSFIVEVEDFGIGITPEAIKGLFLEHLGNSTEGTSGEIGTGLGMLQVKAYIDFVRGDIEVISRDKDTHPIQHGTLVRLTIPALGVAE